MLKKLLLKYLPIHYYKFYKSYSQDGEDMILKSFYENKKKYKGFFVDVGAHHPVRYSNTYFFYKKGWRGINIEPTPTAMRAFKLLRGKDINLNIGIGKNQGFLTFYCFNEPALNTFSQETALQVAQTTNYKIVKETKIEILPLKDILDKHVPQNKKIDFMSIDVEGFDFDVLQSNDWTKYKPEFLLVEGHVDFEDLPNYNIYQFLTEKNYKLIAKTFRTLIFKYN